MHRYANQLLASAPSNEWLNAEKPVLLTFDDGPDGAITAQVLDVLARYRIQSVFFVLGQKLEEPSNRDLLRRIISEGHIVGNHSYSHLDLALQPREVILREIERTQALIETCGASYRVFRPPFGSWNDDVLDVLKNLDYWVLYWNVNSNDWDDSQESHVWVEDSIGKMKQNRQNIVLLHDNKIATSSFLEGFIKRILEGHAAFPPLFNLRQYSRDSDGRRWVPCARDWAMLEGLYLARPADAR